MPSTSCLEALWTSSIARCRGAWSFSDACSDRPTPRVRAAATRVVRYWHNRLSDPLALLAVQVVDENPRARLEAIRALGHVPDARAAEVAMRALDKPVDRFLDYALWLTARDLQPYWLPEVVAGKDVSRQKTCTPRLYVLGAVMVLPKSFPHSSPP